MNNGTSSLQQVEESDVYVGSDMVYVRTPGFDSLYRIESIRDTFERLADELNHISWPHSRSLRGFREVSKDKTRRSK